MRVKSGYTSRIKHGKYLCFCLGQNLLDGIQIAQTTFFFLKKINCNQIQNFFSSNDTAKKMNR